MTGVGSWGCKLFLDPFGEPQVNSSSPWCVPISRPWCPVGSVAKIILSLFTCQVRLFLEQELGVGGKEGTGEYHLSLPRPKGLFNPFLDGINHGKSSQSLTKTEGRSRGWGDRAEIHRATGKNCGSCIEVRFLHKTSSLSLYHLAGLRKHPNSTFHLVLNVSLLWKSHTHLYVHMHVLLNVLLEDQT